MLPIKSPSRSRSPIRLSVLLAICVIAIALATAGVFAQRKSRKISGGGGSADSAKKMTRGRNKSPRTLYRTTSGSNVQDPITGETVGVAQSGPMGIQRTTAEIMDAQAIAPPSRRPPLKPERESGVREDRPQNPNALPVASWPEPVAGVTQPSGNIGSAADLAAPLAPQTVGVNFNAVTGPTETGAFPPDTMGAVGPSQFFLFDNGRMRTFNKTTGVADGFINVDPDVFFASVMTPVSPPVVLNFTSDPNVRYDRLTSRWFVSIIDVPCTNATCTTTAPNRWLVAVSDAASSAGITGATVWTFFFFQADAANFCDYPSLGIDSQALYTGCNMFTGAGSFVGTNGYVVRKTSILGAGPLVFFTFANMAAGAGVGPFAPRGVDNYDPASNEGYFIGVDNATFGTLVFRRVSTPGGTPTISANITLAVSTTSSSVPIDHLGNTGGTNGRIDALDDRLFAAHIRNGRLWTSHNIRVSAAGVASTAAASREGVRWYELNGIRSTDNGGVPIVVQSGTIFDTAATQAAANAYSIPSVMVSGQGHAAFGYTRAGPAFRIDAATNGRLSGDTVGTTGAVALYTASSTAYNPPGDPGGAGGRRWGDYSYTSLDPLDNMTMWTVQEYCNGTNTYGSRVAQLRAPAPPPTNVAAPAGIQLNNPSTNLTVTGTAPAGQGFYDPGTSPAPPHTPFTHISASGAGIIVNSTTFNTPTQVTINVSTVGSTPGTKTITITNPDGQTTTVQVLVGPTAAPASISGRVTTPDGAPLAGVTINLSGGRSAKTITDAGGNYQFTGSEVENFYTVTPSLVNYHFSPVDRSFSLVGNKTDAVFTAAADAVISGNAIDSAEYFVRQHYVDFLNREPDESGFNFWSDQILGCGSNASCLEVKRINVSAAYFLSIEFQDTGGLVDKLYRASYGRRPTYAEFMPDTRLVGHDVIVGRADWSQQLASNKESFLDAWVLRAEFQSIYGALSNSAYVDRLIANTGVSFTTGERDALVSGLGDGSMARAGVLRQIAEDGRFVRAKFNETFVMMEYFGYLRRDPDETGFRFWLQKLNQFNGNFVQAEMVKAFINSGEYRQRFGQ
ncbi:MAG TPA: DUF4214 domain-containing protein [Pyrinomonadaceae bacterium]|nr:DUF4214 domain-containing protein [Pyrinomonadaceae bacterium]